LLLLLPLLLQELLAERPAWPLELLLCRIPRSSEHSLAPALQALCYQFKTGARPAGWQLQCYGRSNVLAGYMSGYCALLIAAVLHSNLACAV
jgi:hypothetical protein